MIVARTSSIFPRFLFLASRLYFQLFAASQPTGFPPSGAPLLQQNVDPLRAHDDHTRSGDAVAPAAAPPPSSSATSSVNPQATYSRYPHVLLPDSTAFRGTVYVQSDRFNSIDIWHQFDAERVAFELDLAQSAGFNFLRIFLHPIVFESKDYDFSDLQTFIRLARSRNLEVMPVLFDGCSDATLLNVSQKCKRPSYTPVYPTDAKAKCWLPSPGYARQNNEKEWGKLEVFVRRLQTWFRTERVGEEKPVIWDLMNEPECAGKELNWAFVEHFLDKMRENDEAYVRGQQENSAIAKEETTQPKQTLIPLTYGAGDPGSLVSQKAISEKLDILSFHTYHLTRASGVAVMQYVTNVGKMFDKQIFNSETGCYSIANPYDATIEVHNAFGIGWTIWELMVNECTDCADRRRTRTGLFYQDGLVRDPAGVLAVRGLFGVGFRNVVGPRRTRSVETPVAKEIASLPLTITGHSSKNASTRPLVIPTDAPPAPPVPFNPLETTANATIQFCELFQHTTKVTPDLLSKARAWVEVLVNFAEGVGGSALVWPLRWQLRNDVGNPSRVEGGLGAGGIISRLSNVGGRRRGGVGEVPVGESYLAGVLDESGIAEVKRIKRLMSTALPTLKGMLEGSENYAPTCTWHQEDSWAFGRGKMDAVSESDSRTEVVV